MLNGESGPTRKQWNEDDSLPTLALALFPLVFLADLKLRPCRRLERRHLAASHRHLRELRAELHPIPHRKAGHLLHHVAGLQELFAQPTHVLSVRAAAAGDTATT